MSKCSSLNGTKTRQTMKSKSIPLLTSFTYVEILLHILVQCKYQRNKLYLVVRCWQVDVYQSKVEDSNTVVDEWYRFMSRIVDTCVNHSKKSNSITLSPAFGNLDDDWKEIKLLVKYMHAHNNII